MGGDRYGSDVLAGDRGRRRRVPEVAATDGLVVEDPESGFCGAVAGCAAAAVTLVDRQGRRRSFPLLPAGFLIDGEPVTLVRPARDAPAAPPSRTASGSTAVRGATARVARASRIWVEGDHDAALLERVWGDDLRIEGVVVEAVRGVDTLPERVAAFGPGPGRRLGVLLDHLVPGSKESAVAAEVAGPHVRCAGHPYVDIWQAVRPAAAGITAWPSVPRGRPWKEGVCAALGVADPAALWRTVLAGVRSYRELETPLVGAVERLIDFVTDPAADSE